MSPPNPSFTPQIDPNASVQVLAGGIRITFDTNAVECVDDIGNPVVVPGATSWCCGLVRCGGRLMTLLDAGLLFGHRPCKARFLVVLKNLPVETALAVDQILVDGASPSEADVILNSETLRDHPAFQPGAAAAPGAVLVEDPS
ncbi:MAG: hypothetical protein VX916_04965 [Planctomycetota bacterium]|nr:hypothetical protein [Planctomycetota bacterium]